MTEKEIQRAPNLIILIPHYNNLEGLYKSLDSIDEDIEYDILIVDDGSKIPPKVEDYNQITNPRKIYIHRLTSNRGISHALNEGLDWILSKDYKYIGRLDCGDLCKKDRFYIQRNYLELNPEIRLLGTQVNFIDNAGALLYTSNLPITDSDIKKALYKNCVVIHPTIMFVSNIIDEIGKYPVNYGSAEDYAFFFKVSKKFKINNLRNVLVDVIIDPNGISVKNRREQFKSKIRIIYHNSYFGFAPLYGLIRNTILMLLPFKMVQNLKQRIFNR